MMLDTVLSFGGSATPQIGVEWFGDALRPIKRLPGQLMGLGMTAEEARRILSVGTYGGTYTQAQVDEAHGVYYGTATTKGAYSGGTVDNPSQQTPQCGTIPEYPDITLMSSPQCSGLDPQCINLLEQIAQWNNAMQREAGQQWNRAVCKRNACLNGTPPGTCDSQYPSVAIPAKPTYPDARAILQRNGTVVGYSNQPIGTIGTAVVVAGPATTGGTGSTTDETAAAKKIYTDLLAAYSGNATVMALFNRDWETGLAWYRSTYGSTKGLTEHVRSRAYDAVQGWLKTAGVLKADGTVNNTNTGGGSGGSGGAGGNSDTGDKTGEKETPASDSQGGMFIVLGAVALLMLAGKGK